MLNNTVTTKYFERVQELSETLPELEERFKIICDLNEEYHQEVGEHLPNFLLEMLGTWYLKEMYKDTRSNKVALEEYPVLTEHQLYRRGRKRVLVEEEAVLDALKFHISNNSSTAQRKTNTIEK